MPKSEKPDVIERIYDDLLDATTRKLRRTIVTSDDVIKGIEWCRKHRGCRLSTKNPANFMKDIIRGKGAAGMWPQRLQDLRIGGRQVTGDGNIFEFVPYADDQNEPFPSRFGFHEGVTRLRLQSVSMPIATKALGRDDETYLIQIAVKLALVETHFALVSRINVIEVNHLQIGIKLRLCEVDSLYAAIYQDSEGHKHQMVITVEAKKRNQRILEEQVIQQVRAAFREMPVPLVVPIAMTLADKGIYLAEFAAVRREELQSFGALELASEALYELVPPVPGI